ncbi:MAG: enolase [Candidatus Micrarchaeota archaeon]|nr:enolase [Candidatus Micrarchaeota archaeon]
MIKDIRVSRIFNSRGEETLRVYVETNKGVFFSDCPSGKSRGSAEPVVKSFEEIISFFTEFRKNLIGFEEEDFSSLDEFVEQFAGERFSRIGGNLAIALSQAVVKAASEGGVYEFLRPGAFVFPYPLGNVIGGGRHGGFTDIQEFLVVPVEAENIREAIETNFSIWRDVKQIAEKKGLYFGRNDEGAVMFKGDHTAVLKVLSRVCEEYGARPGIDVAATTLFRDGKYVYEKEGFSLTPGEQLDFMVELSEVYGLVYIEDPFHEEDFSSFSELRRKVRSLVCGDDLFVSSPERLEVGNTMKSASAVLVKPNQAGTVSRALRTVELARRSKMYVVVSHRSGETCDSFISDFSVGVGAELIKCGITGGERVAKLNRLIEIWEEVSRTRVPRMARIKG